MVWCSPYQRRGSSSSTKSRTTSSSIPAVSLTWRNGVSTSSVGTSLGSSCSTSSSKKLSKDTVLRGEIIPTLPGSTKNRKSYSTSNLMSNFGVGNGVVNNNNIFPGAMTRGLKNLLLLGNDESDSDDEDRESFKLAKSTVLEETAQSRQKFHDSITNMKTKDWQEFQKALRQTRTMTNCGLSMAINCHLVDQSLELSEPFPSLVPELNRRSNNKDGEGPQGLGRRVSAPPALEKRRHLVKRESLRNIMKQKSLGQVVLDSEERACHSDDVSNNTNSNIAKQLGGQVVKISQGIGRRMSAGRPSSSKQSDDDHKPRRSRSVTSDAPVPTAGRRRMMHRRTFSLPDVIGNEASAADDDDVSEAPSAVTTTTATKSVAIFRDTNISMDDDDDDDDDDDNSRGPLPPLLKDQEQEDLNVQSALLNDDDEDDEDDVFFPSKIQRMKARTHRRTSCDAYTEMMNSCNSISEGMNEGDGHEESGLSSSCAMKIADAARLVALEYMDILSDDEED